MGIPIRVHFTFLLLVAWFGMEAERGGRGFLSGVVFIVLLFGCVVLHELGHAAMAMRFGVKTKDIVLYPIGGVARLSSMPAGKAEFLIALAGPAMNMLLAVALIVLAVAFGLPLVPTADAQGMPQPQLVPALISANVFLFLFNLLPAFPMDGGRVLRAMLSFYLPEDRATAIAARVGQVVAVGFAIWGIAVSNFVLVFIAFFVFTGASQEAAFTRGRAAMRGRTVREAMITRFETLAPQDPLSRASELLLATHQHEFPVVDAWGRVAGLLTRGTLLESLGRLGPDAPVLESMSREVTIVAPTTPLEAVLEQLQARHVSTLLVVEDNRLIGMVTVDNLGELVEIARRVGPATGEPT